MAEQKNKTRFPFFRSLAFPLRIFLLILVVSVFIIAALAQYFTASFEDYLAAHVRDMAMNQAKIIASNESIITAVKHRDYKGRCEQVPDMRSCLSSGAMEQGSL